MAMFLATSTFDTATQIALQTHGAVHPRGIPGFSFDVGSVHRIDSPDSPMDCIVGLLGTIGQFAMAFFSSLFHFVTCEFFKNETIRPWGPLTEPIRPTIDWPRQGISPANGPEFFKALYHSYRCSLPQESSRAVAEQFTTWSEEEVGFPYFRMYSLIGIVLVASTSSFRNTSQIPESLHKIFPAIAGFRSQFAGLSNLDQKAFLNFGITTSHPIVATAASELHENIRTFLDNNSRGLGNPLAKDVEDFFTALRTPT